MNATLVMESIAPSGRIALSDGSIWRIAPHHVFTAMAWPGNEVAVRRDDSVVWHYRLTNLETRAAVNMLPEECPQPRLAPRDYLRVIG